MSQDVCFLVKVLSVILLFSLVRRVTRLSAFWLCSAPQQTRAGRDNEIMNKKRLGKRGIME